MEECIKKECGNYNSEHPLNCLGSVDMMGRCYSYIPLTACKDGLKGRLITAAASLSLHKLSEFDDDYPQRFPKRVLREIEKHNDHLRGIARELMAIKDAL